MTDIIYYNTGGVTTIDETVDNRPYSEKTMKEIFSEQHIPGLTPIRTNSGKLKAYSDKNTHHCYVDKVYENLFKDIRESATKILEIGVYGGGSMLAWKHYFQNAQIYGLDISPPVQELVNEDRITQITGNAYSDKIVNSLDNDFDVVLDDGPHTLESFILFIQKYLPKVKSGGYLVIEDIFDINIIPELTECVPEELRKNIQVFDLRYVKNLFDDIVFVVKKD